MQRVLLLVLVAALGFSTGHTSPSADWAINATAIEACSCPHFCMCYFNTHPAGHDENRKTEHYCKFNNADKVNEAHDGSTGVPGVKFWMAGDLGADCSQGQVKRDLV